MIVIGLTGGIASGKSTVSSYLADKHGLPVIDADQIARAVVEPGTRGYKAIVSHFGPSVVQTSQDGSESLDRAALSDIVFNDEKQRKALNGIVHPAVRRAMIWEVVKCWITGEWACVLDVPLLIEAGLYQYVGHVAVVYVTEQLQYQRLLSRPLKPNSDSQEDAPTHLTPEQARSRISSQMPLTAKLEYADYVIVNSGTVNELHRDVDGWVAGLQKKHDGLVRWLFWLIPPLGLWIGACWLGIRWWRRRSKQTKKQNADKRR